MLCRGRPLWYFCSGDLSERWVAVCAQAHTLGLFSLHRRPRTECRLHSSQQTQRPLTLLHKLYLTIICLPLSNYIKRNIKKIGNSQEGADIQFIIFFSVKFIGLKIYNLLATERPEMTVLWWSKYIMQAQEL